MATRPESEGVSADENQSFDWEGDADQNFSITSPELEDLKADFRMKKSFILGIQA